MADIGKKVVSGFRWLVAGRFAGQLVTWVVTIFVIRILSPEDYGLMAMASIAVGFLALFDELGMGAALVQRDTITKTQMSQVFGLVLLVNLFAFVLLLISAEFIAQFFDEPRLTQIIWVLSLQFPLMALKVVPDTIIRRRMAFRGKSAVNFIAVILGSLSSLAFALAGFNVWALVLGSIVTVIARIVGYNVVARYLCWPSFRFKGLGQIVSFGSKVTGERTLWFLYNQADIFLVGRFLGKELLGFYSVALNLATLPMTKLSGLVNEVGFAGFSRIQHVPDEVSRQVKKATRLVSIFAFPVFFGISAIAPEIVSAVLGDKWKQAASPLQILSLVVPLRMLSVVFPTALMGTGQVSVTLGNAGIAAVVLPIGFFIGLKWGLIGVSYAWLIGYTIYFCIMLRRSLPKLNVSFTEYFEQVGGIAASAGVMLLTVHSFRWTLTETWGEGFLSLFVLATVGAITFSLLFWTFHKKSLNVVLGLLKR